MQILISIGYLLLSIILGIHLYVVSAVFKKVASFSREALNEEELYEKDKVSEKEAKTINYFSMFLFVLLGVLIWTFLGITVGRVALEIPWTNKIMWLIYFLMYFVFLRIPFGMGNKMIKKSFGFEKFREQIFFFLAMVISFVLTIHFYESFPLFLKWHLFLLD